MESRNIEEYENEMRWVMRYVLDSGSMNSLDEDERRLLKECVDAKYIEGIELVQVASGSIKGQIKHDIKLTHAGVEFLSREESAQKNISDNGNGPVNKREKNVLKHIIIEVAIALIAGWLIWKLGWN